MIIEFFLFIMLFIFKAPKRKFWILKAILTLVTIVGLTALLCVPLINFYGAISFDRTIVSFFTSIVTLFLLVGLVIGMSTCFDISLYELMSNNLIKNPENVSNIKEDYVNLFDFNEDAKNEKLKSHASKIKSNRENIILNLKKIG